MTASKQEILVSVDALDQSVDINEVFTTFVIKYPQKNHAILYINKEHILSYVLQNLDLKAKANYSWADLQRIARELENCIYAVGNRLPGPLDHISHTLESADELTSNASNLAKHLILGAPAGLDDADLLSSPLACPRNKEAVFTKNDPEFLGAVRREFCRYLFNMAQPAIESRVIANPDDEKQLLTFIHTFLGLYPILEPAHGERITIPRKLNPGIWTWVEYQFERIDISPTTGLIASLLTEDKDRMYAYGLTPKSHPQIESYLLFSGTTFEVGQGSDLSVLSNMAPGNSLGELHDMTHVSRWLNAQKTKVITAGQSQGGVLAMLTAARFPHKIVMAHCFNPTALSKDTLARLLPRWLTIPEESRPTVYIYTQHGDIVFELEQGFLPGKNTHIYKMLSDKETPAINASVYSLLPGIIPKSLIKKLTPVIARIYEAHVHLFAGHKGLVMLELNLDKEQARFSREMTSTGKWMVTSMIFHDKKINLFQKLFNQKYPQGAPSSDIKTDIFHFALQHPSLMRIVALIYPDLDASMNLIETSHSLNSQESVSSYGSLKLIPSQQEDYQIPYDPQELILFSKDVTDEMTRNPQALEQLMHSTKMTLIELSRLQSKTCLNLLRDPQTIYELVNIVPFSLLSEKEPYIFNAILSRPRALVLLVKEAKVPINTLLALDLNLIAELMRNPVSVVRLINEASLPFEQLIMFSSSTRRDFIIHSNAVSRLIKSTSMSIEYLLTLDQNTRIELFTQSIGLVLKNSLDPLHSIDMRLWG